MTGGLPLATRVPTESAVRRALRRARDGALLDASEATVLLHARGEHLDDLLVSAARVRDAGLVAAGRPGVISYSRKVFIPLTRLCRDRCGYCTFATVPGRLPAPYLSPDEVLDIARKGAGLGCKEALFTLGDRPEDRWPAARTWLHAHGYDDTLSYVRAMAIRVLEETGLLPHLNPGVLTWQDFQRLKPVAPSMGMMLETTAQRLFAEPGGPHFGSPDKDPQIRLRVLEDAGRCAVPFTTGILVGIGETPAERAMSLFAIRQIARRYNGIQEVIVQNFRAKPDTRMRDVADAELDDLAATIAVARLVLGPRMRIQAPPNLVDAQYELMLRAGIDDWGGVSPVTPDHVNPERPWPEIGELAQRTAQAGFRLRERLTIYPEYVVVGEPWLDPRLRAHVMALADGQGMAAEGPLPRGLPWQEPDGGFGGLAASGRTELHVEIDTTGRTNDRRGDFDAVYGNWGELQARATGQARKRSLVRFDANVLAALRHAADSPGGVGDDEALALLSADGPELEALVKLADDVRRDAVGDEVTYVVTRNINFTTPIRSRSSRWGTGPRRRGRRVRRRCACRAGFILTCPARPISISLRRSSGAVLACTSTRSARWRSSTVRRAPTRRSGTGWPAPVRRALIPIPEPRPRFSTTMCAGSLPRGSCPRRPGSTWSLPRTGSASRPRRRSCTATSTRLPTGRPHQAHRSDPGRDRGFHRVRAAAVRAP